LGGLRDLGEHKLLNYYFLIRDMSLIRKIRNFEDNLNSMKLVVYIQCIEDDSVEKSRIYCAGVSYPEDYTKNDGPEYFPNILSVSKYVNKHILEYYKMLNTNLSPLGKLIRYTGLLNPKIRFQSIKRIKFIEEHTKNMDISMDKYNLLNKEEKKEILRNLKL
jgi:hypothetical protein